MRIKPPAYEKNLDIVYHRQERETSGNSRNDCLFFRHTGTRKGPLGNSPKALLIDEGIFSNSNLLKKDSYFSRLRVQPFFTATPSPPSLKIGYHIHPVHTRCCRILGESLFFKENDLVHWSLPILWHINTVSMSPYKIYECQTLWVLVSALVSLRI